MSSVLARKRGTSGMEFYKCAVELRETLSKAMMNESIVPKRWRQFFTFLKTQFFLSDSGRVIEKPCRDSVIRERRKLKAFRRFLNAGEMALDKVARLSRRKGLAPVHPDDGRSLLCFIRGKAVD